MKKASVIVFFLLFSNFVCADNEKLLQLLNDQVDAFNQQDIKRLVANVTEDFKYLYLTADELILETEGKENFKKAMITYFKPGNKPFSVIKNYAIDGNRISFKEVVSHKNKDGHTVSSSAMGIYQFKNDKIFRAWYFID